ncbi:MAG: SRPBCC domain-containing protein [Bacteroidota bacterium]
MFIKLPNINRLSFAIQIKAPREKVWDVLWNDNSYRQWTRVFSEGSYAVSDWKEGSKVHFLSPSGDGMYSTIAKSLRPELMSFKHLGVIKEGKEQPLGEESKKWSGAMENYTLREKDAGTALTVDIDVTDEHRKYFSEVFPKALQIVKELSEKS